MKRMIFLMTALMIATISQNSLATTWYGFCYGKESGKTYCSPVQSKTPNFSTDCKSWAKGNGFSVWGNHTGTSIPSLENKQSAICYQVLGGSSSTSKSFQCFAEILCPSPTSSSIRLEPLSSTVMAEDTLQAAKKCLSTFPNAYLHQLKETTAGECYVQVKALE